VTQFVSTRSDLLGATDLLKQAALDPYSFVRDAYVQQRRSMTYKGQAAEPALPDYGDPGASASPAGAQAAAPALAEPGDLPQYQDPGDGAGGPAPASSAQTPAGAAN
jgi:phospholipid-binding lipoprotein MlaA